LAENTDDLFVGKTLLHGDVLMWLMKTLLTSRCINQRGAGHFITPLGFKISVFLLAISSIAGFASKYFALVVCSSATVTVRMTELIQSKIKEYEENCKIRDEIGRDVGYVSDIELSIDSFTEQYVNLFPFQGLRNKVKKGMNFYSENRSGNRAAVHGVVFQGIALFLQALSYIAFLVVITSFINLR
ncbi:hypothetical protein EGM92_28465, partial [Enterobacter cloacae]